VAFSTWNALGKYGGEPLETKRYGGGSLIQALQGNEYRVKGDETGSFEKRRPIHGHLVGIMWRQAMTMA